MSASIAEISRAITIQGILLALPNEECERDFCHRLERRLANAAHVILAPLTFAIAEPRMNIGTGPDPDGLLALFARIISTSSKVCQEVLFKYRTNSGTDTDIFRIFVKFLYKSSIFLNCT